MTSRARSLGIAGLLVVLAISSVRLAGEVSVFVRWGLQADLSAYYAAGESLNRGLSPYRNQAAHDLSLWDGVALGQPSRFLYPPLAALPFRALAWLPYAQAKVVWTALGFALAALTLLLSARLCGGRPTVRFLIAAVWLVWGWPFLLELERGQIDLLTLALLLGAALMQRRSGRSSAWLAGGLWALAVAFKLHVALGLPFLLLRRRFDVLLAALLAAVGLLLVSALTMPAATHEYLTEAVPRMIRYGINPPPGAVLAPALRQALFAGYPPAIAHAHGGVFVRFPLSFEAHASLVWALAGEEAVYPGLLSLLVAGVILGGAAWATRRRVKGAQPVETLSTCAGSPDHGSGSQDLAWLVLALCCVLLAAPLTWSMNVVWLLPAVFVVFSAPEPTAGWAQRHAGIALGVVALGLAAVPDRFAWPWPTWLHWLSGHKYLIGELVVALLMVQRLIPDRRTVAAVALVAPSLGGDPVAPDA